MKGLNLSINQSDFIFLSFFLSIILILNFIWDRRPTKPTSNASIEAQNFKEIIHHFRGIYIIYLELIKQIWHITTCNQFNPRTQRTLSPSLRTMGGVRIGWGQPSRENFEPDQKLLPAPPNFKKNFALAFLKAAWLQIPYWVHFTFKV